MSWHNNLPIKKGLFIVEERPKIMPESMTPKKLVEGATRPMVQFDTGGHIGHKRR
jgi:hypothetical protein